MEKTYILTQEQKLKLWGEGEWIEEPDLVTFKYRDLDCRIKRPMLISTREEATILEKEIDKFGMGQGHLCGYVKLPANHKWIGKDDTEIDIECHGGITYTNLGEDGFWIGFDCAHTHDIVPGLAMLDKMAPEKETIKDIQKLKERLLDSTAWEQTYRTVDYCIEECKSMVDQILKD